MVLKTPGSITFQEYNQAKIESRLTIAKAIVCCYCQEPVEINSSGPETLLDCEQHGTMRLEVDLDNNAFYLHRINGRLLGEESTILSKDKACPFCSGGMKAGITYNYETRLENQLLRYPLSCADCGVSFYVVARNRELRFQPKPEHFEFSDFETTSPVSPIEVSETTPTERSQPVIASESETGAAAPRNKKGKDVKGQILRVLRASGVPMRRSQIQAHVEGNVVKPLNKLVKDGLVIRLRKGWYVLPR